MNRRGFLGCFAKAIVALPALAIIPVIASKPTPVEAPMAFAGASGPSFGHMQALGQSTQPWTVVGPDSYSYSSTGQSWVSLGQKINTTTLTEYSVDDYRRAIDRALRDLRRDKENRA